jgi:vancomycin resistance protein YoaR
VGGLSQQEAEQRLEARFGRLFLALNSETRPFKVSLSELGGSPMIDAVVHKAYQIGRDGSLVSNFLRVYGSRATGERFALPVTWDKSALVAKLYTINHLYKEDPRDAQLQITGRGVEVVPEKTGRAMNIGETAAQIQKKYYIGLKELDLVSREVQPTLTAASLAGKDVELAHYTTNFNSGLVGRTRNIHVAAAAIEGSVLMPGETFSFNSKTGERTFEKGYRMAKIFERKPGEEEAEVVDGLAGGVCQVSSTLFNAVRKLNAQTDGGVKVVERHHHSLPVTYVPTGMDATVAYPALDFRFRNSLSHPVYLRTAIHGSRLTISVWGRVPEGTSTQLASFDGKNEE